MMMMMMMIMVMMMMMIGGYPFVDDIKPFLQGDGWLQLLTDSRCYFIYATLYKRLA